MPSIVINSDKSLQQAIQSISEEYSHHRYLKVNIKTGKDRSLEQNAISHKWYEIIASNLPEENMIGWKCFCKLHFGVPILRTEDDDFREAYDKAIKGLMYEQKLSVMNILPVTSLMTKGQLSRYLEAMQNHFTTRHGLVLEFPEEGVQ